MVALNSIIKMPLERLYLTKESTLKCIIKRIEIWPKMRRICNAAQWPGTARNPIWRKTACNELIAASSSPLPPRSPISANISCSIRTQTQSIGRSEETFDGGRHAATRLCRVTFFHPFAGKHVDGSVRRSAVDSRYPGCIRRGECRWTWSGIQGGCESLSQLMSERKRRIQIEWAMVAIPGTSSNRPNGGFDVIMRVPSGGTRATARQPLIGFVVSPDSRIGGTAIGSRHWRFQRRESRSMGAFPQISATLRCLER